MNKESNKKVLKVLTVTLWTIVLILCGWLIYDKFSNQEEPKPTEVEKPSEENSDATELSDEELIDDVTDDNTYYEFGGSKQQATYTLTFNNNGGSGCGSKTVLAGTTWGVLCSPVRSGYIFGGWYTTVSGGMRITSTSVAVKNLTVYAHWNANNYKCYACGGTSGTTYTWTNAPSTNCSLQSGITTQAECQNRNTVYTLTFNNNGGSGCTSTSTFKGSAWGVLCSPVRSGYTFDGWYTSASGGTKVTSTSVATSNLTVYAHWKKSA